MGYISSSSRATLEVVEIVNERWMHYALWYCHTAADLSSSSWKDFEQPRHAADGRANSLVLAGRCCDDLANGYEFGIWRK